MANTKISQLTANTNPNGNEELVYAYNNANGKMTLDTMKTFASADSQEKLVSWTNIKTINNQSILWAGNINIQWGGGWGWEWYDAIVDVSWQGDYTTIGAAVDANKRNIFVRNWTYTETQWHLVTFNAVDWLSITGQSKEWVVVSVALTWWVNPWSEVDAWAAFLYIDESSSDADVVIKNMTLNLTTNISSEAAIIRIKYAWSQNIHSDNLLVQDCIINASNVWSSRWYFQITEYADNSQRQYWTFNINNCVITTISDTEVLVWRFHVGDRVDERWYFNNCDFIIRWNNNNAWYIALQWATDCNVLAIKTWMWWVSFSGYYLDSCYINLNNRWNVTFDVILENITNCYIRWYRSTSVTENLWLPSGTLINDWASNTNYSVWDYVYAEREFWKCITAHTSSSSFDQTYWTWVSNVSLYNISWCDAAFSSEPVLLSWKIIGNQLWVGTTSAQYIFKDGSIVNWNQFWLISSTYIDRISIINGNNMEDWSNLYYNATQDNIITNNIWWAAFVSLWSWWRSIVTNNINLIS